MDRRRYLVVVSRADGCLRLTLGIEGTGFRGLFYPLF